MWGGKANVSAAWEKWHSLEDGANIFENAGEEQDIKQRRWKMWVPLKLIKTLALPVPVSCDVPTQSSGHPPTRNELPPQFFFTAPALFYLQNFLQAVVVA